MNTALPILLRFLVVLLLGTLLLEAAPYTPEQRQSLNTYASVGRWRGTVESTRRSTLDKDDVSSQRSEHGCWDQSATATFVLERHGVGNPQWYSAESSVVGTLRDWSTASDAFYRSECKSTADYAGPAVPEDIRLTISLSNDKTLEWMLGSGGALVNEYTIDSVCDDTRPGYGHQVSETRKAYWPHMAVRTPLELKATKPGVLTRTFEKWDNSESPFDTSKRTSLIRHRILLVPDDTDFELIVEIEGYDTWMPKALLTGAGAGEKIQVSATFRPKPGKDVAAKPKRFLFELKDTSREPGVCMNWPRLAAQASDTPKEDKDFDLRFDPLGGKPEKPDAQQLEVTRMEETDKNAYKALATIQSFDFGGHANLLVTAELEDGRLVYGEFKDTRVTLINIPKRRTGSVCAEAWRKKWVCDAPDESDSDPKPAGDGNAGDGYSAYEEYRGFISNGKHVRTRPGQKDLFVVNKIGDVALEGISRFEMETDMIVHKNTRRGEMTEDRVLNSNRSERSPRSSQEYQHGILVDLRTEKDGVSITEIKDGQAWRPKNVDRVAISTSLVDGATTERGGNKLAKTVAHELSHGCGVRHHGDKDPRWVCLKRFRAYSGTGSMILELPAKINGATGDFETVPDVDGVARGPQVRVLVEGGGEVASDAAYFDTPRYVYVGVTHGEHSGNSNCYMRYIVAKWYKPETSPRDRVYFDEQHPIGITLCTSKSSDGNWQQRFGDADKGDCKHRFAVRDDAPDPGPR